MLTEIYVGRGMTYRLHGDIPDLVNFKCKCLRLRLRLRLGQPPPAPERVSPRSNRTDTDTRYKSRMSVPWG